jgi:methionyl-tRNA formyltransferase
VEKEQLAAWQRRADQIKGEPLRIVTIDAPDAAILREKARAVRHVNRRVRDLLQRMRVTMYRNNGVGLAAPQVGVGQRLIVVDAGDHHCALVNPEITYADGTQTEPVEGCLSIPELLGVVERARRIRVRALDAEGRQVSIDAEGYFARVLQHEIDHLDGILFTDRATRVIRAGPETKLKVVFMGSAAFGATVLEALLAAEVVPAAVVTRPDRPAGRGLTLHPTPVKRVALDAELPVFTPESARDRSLEASLRELAPDVLITAAYGQIVPDRVLSLPRLGAVNVHPSLLPKLRGPDPIRRALWLGCARTGVTVLRMSAELDAGDVLGQTEIEVLPDENGEELAARLAAEGGALLLRVLRALATDTARPVPQDHGAATYAPKIQPEEEIVDWHLSARELAQRVRALAPRPGLRTPSGLKLLRVRVQEAGATAEAPGTVVAVGDVLAVQTGAGLLEVQQLQAPGGRPLNTADYLRGHPLAVGHVLT